MGLVKTILLALRADRGQISATDRGWNSATIVAGCWWKIVFMVVILRLTLVLIVLGRGFLVEMVRNINAPMGGGFILGTVGVWAARME